MPELGRTQYCFGAVVLTLKATGCECGLRMSKTSFTTRVKGPVGKKERAITDGLSIEQSFAAYTLSLSLSLSTYDRRLKTDRASTRQTW